MNTSLARIDSSPLPTDQPRLVAAVRAASLPLASVLPAAPPGVAAAALTPALAPPRSAGRSPATLAGLCRGAAAPAGVVPNIISFAIAAVAGELVNLGRQIATGNPPVGGTAQCMQFDLSVPGPGLREQSIYWDPFYVTVHGYDRNHFRDTGAAQGLVAAPWWSAAYYQQRYPDLGDVMPIHHMDRVGLTEGRALSPLFDPTFYFHHYADLQQAFGHLFGRDRNVALLNHYIDFGLDEGRTASTVACARAYLERYDDLGAALGRHNFRAAVIHLYHFGLGEGRDPSPAAGDGSS